MSVWMSCSSSSLGLSVYVLAATLVAQLVLGVALAWVLARKRFPGHGLLDSLVSLPLVFPPIVIGYLLLLALGRQGLAGQCHRLVAQYCLSACGLVDRRIYRRAAFDGQTRAKQHEQPVAKAA